MSSQTRAWLDKLTSGSSLSTRSNRSNLFEQSNDRSTSINTRSSSGTNLALAVSTPTRDRTAPTARLAITNITSKIGSVQTFNVVYIDRGGSGLRRATIGTGDITVTGPNGFSQLASLTGSVKINAKRTRAVATYSIVSKDGAWDSTENGTYTLSLGRRQVSDARRNFARPRALGSMQVNVPNPLPTAALTSQGFTGTADYTFSVNYADDSSINPASIDGNDILVTGPNSFSQLASLVSVAATSNGSQTATYRITAAGGTLDATDNGTYTIALQANQVGDIQGGFAPTANLGTFDINVSTIPPSATLSPIESILGTQGAKTFTVTYADNGAVTRSSVDSNDILVTGPNGFSQLATLIGVNLNADSPSLVATYQVTPPGGTWDDTESGLYGVTLQPNQIRDNEANFSVQSLLGTFVVNPSRVRLEAESFTQNRQNIRVESKTFVSGGQVIRVDRLLNGSTGTAATTFTGASGRYDVRVGYFDENDGTSQITIRLGNLELPTIQLNRDLGSSNADTPTSYVQETIATGVTLNQNDLVTYVGTFSGGEAARFDYIEFIQV
ncbi:MAG: hypothetical protein SFY66_26125 [Oculatellaceae cyanobacterium bins.114]|nr:hypothetical protein [Oculatellaceae cyanobacterium bins.114]